MQQVIQHLQSFTVIILAPLMDDAAVFACGEIAREAFPQVAFGFSKQPLDKGFAYRLYVGVNAQVFAINVIRARLLRGELTPASFMNW